ncbi:MAG: ABC transporter permease, partial [Acidobacteria bacterium]|nr:ABC transporter permease [Acidobacteriota bacterium]
VSTNAIAFRTMRLLAIVCGALVLLGVANLANLLIFQSVKLARDSAIRQALGASLRRIIQLTLTESLLLSFSGAVLGVIVAAGIRLSLEEFTIWGIGTPELPLDWRVMAATTALAVAIGVGFGIGPAILAARTPAAGALGRGERAGAGRFRQVLAAAQLAVSLTLVIGALLFLGTLRNLRSLELGFDPSHVTTARVDLRSYGYDQPRMWSYYKSLLANLETQPGVDAAAITYGLPVLGGNYESSLHRPGADAKSAMETQVKYVSPGYFNALRTPVIRGRGFVEAESFTADSATTVVLSAGAARSLFGAADPIGQTVVEPGRSPRSYTVVGIAADARWNAIDEAPAAVAYFPYSPGIAVMGSIVTVRSDRPTVDVLKMIQASAAALDPSVPFYRDQTMEQILNKSLAEQRLFAWVLSLLGVVAFVLAAVGLYGLISQMVAERSREFGIRLAIGAAHSAILGLLLRQAAVVAAAGIVIGLAATAASRKLIESYLFGISSGDPWTYITAVLILLGVVAVAAMGPARTVLHLQPSSVLRHGER